TSRATVSPGPALSGAVPRSQTFRRPFFSRIVVMVAVVTLERVAMMSASVDMAFSSGWSIPEYRVCRQVSPGRGTQNRTEGLTDQQAGKSENWHAKAPEPDQRIPHGTEQGADGEGRDRGQHLDQTSPRLRRDTAEYKVAKVDHQLRDIAGHDRGRRMPGEQGA